MGKLHIQPGQLFLDIGCGSGAVSAAAARYTGKFFSGEAADLLPGLPEVDRCFIGGTRGIDRFFPLLLEKAAPGCIIVADLARIGIAARLADLMKEAGIFQELIQIQVCRGYDLAGDIALRPVNPIFMVIGKC